MHSQVPGRNGLYRSKKCPQVVFKRIRADTAQGAIAQPCPPAGLGQGWILECGHSNPAMGHLGKHREVLSISRNRQRARERPAEPTVQSRITLYKQKPRRPPEHVGPQAHRAPGAGEPGESSDKQCWEYSGTRETIPRISCDI